MNLILEVVARDGQSPDGDVRKVFGEEGGRIGRASDCEWVLPSPYISRYHASVVCIDGAFYIVSTSENGVALNDAQAMLPQLEHRAIKDGDRLFIDEYEIAVALSDTAPAAAQSDKAAIAEQDSVAEDFTAGLPLLRTAFGLDPLRNFTPSPPTTPGTPPHEAAWNHSSGLADHFVPPAVPAGPVALPADWDQTNLPLVAPPSSAEQSTFPPARPLSPPPQSKAAAQLEANSGTRSVGNANGTFDVSEFLRGAGIEPDGLSPEMARTLGRLLRSVVQGLIEALHTRADFRGQFRLPVTRVKMSENNPLKFAVDADDALTSLLRRRADRYLGPLEAVEDAFDDIRTHHLAMVVGMRAGFESVLNRFDPRRLAPEFDKRARRSALWPMPAGMRYWRQYLDLFESLAGDADSAFERLFREEFAQAYERHLDSSKRQHGKSSV